MGTLLSDIDSAAGRLDTIANTILTYISSKNLRRTSSETTARSSVSAGDSIETILASVVPDAIALDRSRRLEGVQIETIVQFGKFAGLAMTQPNTC